MARNKAKSDQLLKAALIGDPVSVSDCLASGINVESVGQDGRTSLMNAAGGCHTEVVRKLLAAKANVNAKSNNGNDALFYLLAPDWAGLFQHSKTSHCLDTLKALLTGGAQVTKDHLLIAILSHDTDLVATLVRSGRGAASNPTSIHGAIAEAKSLPHEKNVDEFTFDANVQLLLEVMKKRY